MIINFFLDHPVERYNKGCIYNLQCTSEITFVAETEYSNISFKVVGVQFQG